MDDNLAAMFASQATLMKVLGVESSGDPNPGTPEFESLQEAAIGITCEAAEILDALTTSTKPWKHTSHDEAMRHAQHELVDALFYAVEFAILSGLDADALTELFARKQVIVCSRILKFGVPHDMLVHCLDKRLHGFSHAGMVVDGVDLEPALDVVLVAFPEVALDETIAGAFAHDPMDYVAKRLGDE